MTQNEDENKDSNTRLRLGLGLGIPLALLFLYFYGKYRKKHPAPPHILGLVHSHSTGVQTPPPFSAAAHKEELLEGLDKNMWLSVDVKGDKGKYTWKLPAQGRMFEGKDGKIWISVYRNNKWQWLPSPPR